MPETRTEVLKDIAAVASWLRQHASPEDCTRINAIIETFGQAKQQEFADQPTAWEIDWFYRGSAKEFYRVALVNTRTQRELWAYS